MFDFHFYLLVIIYDDKSLGIVKEFEKPFFISIVCTNLQLTKQRPIKRVLMEMGNRS